MIDKSRVEQITIDSVHAFDRMKRTSSFERRELLRNVASRLTEQHAMFAELIATEVFKPLSIAKAEVTRAIATFEIAAEEATRIGGESIALDIMKTSAGYRGEWRRVPAGPVIGIAPFNFPLNLVAHKVAPAIACGCSIVLKPPPQAPKTSLALAKIFKDAGAIDNALQVVPCANDVAEMFVRDDRFATFSFTGSANVGWHLKSIAGKKRVLLELGGNAAAIVHEDARDLNDAAARITTSAFAYAGQVCIKTQRVYVHDAIAEKFEADLVKRARAVVAGDPLKDESILGPMIDEANAKRVESWIEEARQKGARVLCGGKRIGSVVEATVIAVDGDGRGLKIVDEEAFGPVVTLHRYATWDDAIKMAGDTKYGLQIGIFTDSHSKIRDAFNRLDVGGIVVGDTASFRVDSMPYGGVRDSGLGREGVRFAIEEMTVPKLLVYREA